MANTPDEPTAVPDDEPMLPGTDDPALESELLDDIALDDPDGELAADEELSIVDEDGAGELPNELDEEE